MAPEIRLPPFFLLPLVAVFQLRSYNNAAPPTKEIAFEARRAHFAMVEHG